MVLIHTKEDNVAANIITGLHEVITLCKQERPGVFELVINALAYDSWTADLELDDWLLLHSALTHGRVHSAVRFGALLAVSERMWEKYLSTWQALGSPATREEWLERVHA